MHTRRIQIVINCCLLAFLLASFQIHWNSDTLNTIKFFSFFFLNFIFTKNQWFTHMIFISQTVFFLLLTPRLFNDDCMNRECFLFYVNPNRIHFVLWERILYYFFSLYFDCFYVSFCHHRNGHTHTINPHKRRTIQIHGKNVCQARQRRIQTLPVYFHMGTVMYNV